MPKLGAGLGLDVGGVVRDEGLLHEHKAYYNSIFHRLGCTGVLPSCHAFSLKDCCMGTSSCIGMKLQQWLQTAARAAFFVHCPAAHSKMARVVVIQCVASRNNCVT